MTAAADTVTESDTVIAIARERRHWLIHKIYVYRNGRRIR